jgi:hypothetical protein
MTDFFVLNNLFLGRSGGFVILLAAFNTKVRSSGFSTRNNCGDI